MICIVIWLPQRTFLWPWQPRLRFARANSIDYRKKFLFVFSWNAGRVVRIMNDCKECAMDYGRPMKRFFIEISNIWALADKLGGIWGYFQPIYQHLFWSVRPLSMFSINQPLFLQKSLYIQIPSIYLGLGFEFGPQRIRNLAIVCS